MAGTLFNWIIIILTFRAARQYTFWTSRKCMVYATSRNKYVYLLLRNSTHFSGAHLIIIQRLATLQ